MTAQNIKIMIAAHKVYDFPLDPGYLPVHVGKAMRPDDLGIIGDDSGDNISSLNKSFCELTGLYWLWKNEKADYYGLAHYRRYFKALSNTNLLIKKKPIATSDDLLVLMNDFDVVVSKKRCYVIDTIRTHYNNAHYESDLLALEKVISELSPSYSDAFTRVFNSRCVSLYNMFVMDGENFHAYCEWLFSLLLELEKRIPYKDYGPYQGRVFGFLSERLLNVWLEYNKDTLRIEYLPIMNIEGENLLSKAFGLLKRKFLADKLD